MCVYRPQPTPRETKSLRTVHLRLRDKKSGHAGWPCRMCQNVCQGEDAREETARGVFLQEESRLAAGGSLARIMRSGLGGWVAPSHQRLAAPRLALNICVLTGFKTLWQCGQAEWLKWKDYILKKLRRCRIFKKGACSQSIFLFLLEEKHHYLRKCPEWNSGIETGTLRQILVNEKLAHALLVSSQVCMTICLWRKRASW